MGGTPENARLWANADVYIADSLSTVNPANVGAIFGAGWNQVGLLDGDDGMPEARDEDTDDKFAWGGILVRTSRSHFKLTKSFSALEDNTIVREILWPGSTDSVIKVPVPIPRKIAFEVRDPGTGAVKRLITRNHAIITLDGDLDENETDLSKMTFAAVIYPDGDGVLFDRQSAPMVTSLDVTPATDSIVVGEITGLTATATYDDASTADVTDSATWTTSNAARATVAHGYVKGIAVGSAATITASYSGQSDTAAVTVTA
jgi:hypothetical protein